MSSFIKNIFWGAVILLGIAIIFASLGSSGPAVQTIGLGDLAQKINKGEVSSILVTGDSLTITLKDDSKLKAEKEAEAGLTETLTNLGVSTGTLQSVKVDIKGQSGTEFWAGIIIPTVLPLLLIGIFFYFTFRQARSGMNQAMGFGQAKIKMYGGGKEKTKFKDVAGLKEAKEELVEVVDFLKNPKKFELLGAKVPKGVLLVGLPGTGKTMIARAVAGESNVPFFHMAASEFVEMFVGVGAQRVRDAFAIAKKASPAILFIDEIDAIGRQRGAGLGGGNDEREQTLNQILVEMDGFEKDTNIIILAATNRPDVLDPALLRPGRFDRRVVLDLPDVNDRQAILEIHSKGKPIAKETDFHVAAQRTAGFSGADLANLMNEAAILTARRNKKEVGQNEILESIEKVMLGPERRSRAITPKEKELTAYHEAGHALVATTLKDSDPVHKVSIVSRGFAGGYTMKLPAEEEHLRTKTQFLNDIAVMMGGFASEKIIFKDISTGASNDLKHATETARKLVTKYGMSDLGPIVFGETEELIFLGREIATDKNYSEAVAVRIDEEVKKLIERGLHAAEKIIAGERKALDAIAHALLEKETLERDEFEKIVEPFKLKSQAV